MNEPVPTPSDPPRFDLDARRSHEAFDLAYAGIPISAGLGRFDDGRLAEVFLHAGKDGTQLDAMMRETAVLLSLLLQHGVTTTTIAHALPQGERGEPVGPIGLLLETLELQAAGNRAAALRTSTEEQRS